MTYEHFYALAEDLALNEKVDFNQLFCSFKDEIYPKYQNYVVTNNLLDYDDMLIFADQLTNFPDIQQSWGQKFGAILVDEFQDTSERQ